MVNATGLLGVLFLVRHGDRLEFFQDPLTYNPSATFLTALGTVEEAALGNLLQEIYLLPSSPSAITGISFPVADVTQLLIRADAAGEGETILSSVGALIQGLYPPTTDFNSTLANGTTVIGADGGEQFLPVESVEQYEDISLNSFTSCPNFDAHTSAFYNSSQFSQEAQTAAPFLAALTPFLDGKSTDFINMFNIFDYVNVQNIHNASFHSALPSTFVEQAYGFANFHEGGVFSDASPDGIGNVAIRTMLPSLFTSLQRIANTSDPLKLALNGISYKPFISFFNLTAATADVSGDVDYASALAIEVNPPSASDSEAFVTIKFKNGTSDAAFHPVNLGRFGENATSIPLSTFVSELQVRVLFDSLMPVNG
ncbi:hypothetical protein EWM64_g8795 [Hericium alpestre]|uniref:Phosphoglycerate mutase-like protein n=1 Tax=Hericium alpestre TaxID=135208 RepID=A0A4Y9ZMA4_9AGAM|nr:hypothetical protein EWM64_g8795 [Hericium alpestre]